MRLLTTSSLQLTSKIIPPLSDCHVVSVCAPRLLLLAVCKSLAHTGSGERNELERTCSNYSGSCPQVELNSTNTLLYWQILMEGVQNYADKQGEKKIRMVFFSIPQMFVMLDKRETRGHFPQHYPLLGSKRHRHAVVHIVFNWSFHSTKCSLSDIFFNPMSSRISFVVISQVSSKNYKL